ncbi:MAG: TetR/AcrR family transcriptional regulator [Caldilineaceae bacterium]|nr:TetR/AcrR family transcriptional regulator [Caldilineaceae bacterium]MBP8106377.1 TetR/AcrR family transcriptional regulator [Caldilineaceae bacterium]MBP8121440.1 TetR/AcrR family transcriptional regulator [Caldilineaceae bacterium]MBP9073695.1 TetR/AcrR family transcriptional regulator [Caldilineaceae bacterium]
MPKETFFNLPEQKRQMIEEAAIDEFAAWGYDNASITRIVIACQIAKGSFYQYFEDKKDLYTYLIMHIGEEKLTFLSPVTLNGEGSDLFVQLAAMYRAGLAFARSHPKAALIGNQVYKNLDHPVHKEIMADGKGMAIDFYARLLEAAIDRGEVRPDIPIRFAAFLLMQMNTNTIEYYFDVVKGEGFDFSRMDDDVMETVNLFLDFIKFGIGVQREQVS